MSGSAFNIDGGYLEGLCRGFKCGILKQSDYLNLVQCETLEGLYENIFLSFRSLSTFISMFPLSIVKQMHRKELHG